MKPAIGARNEIEKRLAWISGAQVNMQNIHGSKTQWMMINKYEIFRLR